MDSSTGQVLSAQAFLEDWHVRVSWVAFATLWVVWGLVWTVRHAFGRDEIRTVTDTAPEQEGTETSNKIFSARSLNGGTLGSRVERAHNLLRDVLLLLLSVLSVNTFARGSTRGVMILSWFIVAFAVFWFAVSLVYENRFIRLFYALIFYALGLAILGLAFQQGF